MITDMIRNKHLTAKKAVPVLFIVILFAALAGACAGGPSSKSIVREESRLRAYERFKTDHKLSNKSDLERNGMYYDGKKFYVVMGLSDSGTDRYPEWACNTLLTSLYGYKAVRQDLVSDEEFFALVLDFKLEEIVEGKYSSRAIVTVKESRFQRFLDSYAEED